MNRIDNFISKLEATPSRESGVNQYTNPYFGDSESAKICRSNLKLYLELAKQKQSKIMLVGEAPGCHGCAKTGIPFTDEWTLNQLQDDLEWQTLGNEKELSANIIWQQLQKYHCRPLMWNAFPFHPHFPNSTKNRTPTQKELDTIGQEFLQELKKIFTVEHIYAVGRKAQQSLALDDNHYIRHPSHGGQKECAIGLAKILQRQSN